MTAIDEGGSVTRIALALIVAAALAAVTAQSAAAPVAKTKICYQLQGPYAKWLLPVAVAKAVGVPRTVAGTTWTAFATGVPCQSKGAAKTLLAKYPAARKTASGLIKPPLKGFNLCSTSVGNVGCVGKNLSTFTLLETGPYSLAQIKQLAATGKLPVT